MNLHAHTILCVDDEKNILNALKRLLRKEDYKIITASSGKAGLELLNHESVQVVISDQRMPEMNGTDFLAKVKERFPDIIRIILTGYTDVDSITESINKGNIYKFFLKPWNDQNLKLEVRQALEQYELKRMNRQLHNTVIEQNEELKVINENLESIVQERTEMINIQNHALELSRAVLDDVPFPIIGISTDGMVVLLNQEAHVAAFDGEPIYTGQSISACFPEAICMEIKSAIKSNVRKEINAESAAGKPCHISLVPLSGRHQGQGIVMTILPNEDSK